MERDFFHDVAYRNPGKAMDILSMHTRVRPESQDDLADGLRGTLRNLRVAEKEPFLSALVSAHPDYDLFMDSIQPNSQSEFEEKASACGCSAGANGEGTVQSYMASGEATNIMSEYKDKLNRMEQEQNSSKSTNDKIFKLVIGAAIVFIMYKILNK